MAGEDPPKENPLNLLAELMPELPAKIRVLEPRQQKLVMGHALWKYGRYSLRKAAALVGLEHHQRLCDYNRKMARQEGAEGRMDEAEALAFEAVQHAWRQMNQHLADETYDKGSLPVIAGIAFDKLTKGQQIRKPAPPDVLSELLQKLGSDGGSVEVTVKPNASAIDVTPEPEE